MCDALRAVCASFLLAMFVIACVGSQALTQDAVWRVSKSSGEVSVTTSAGQQTALTDGATLKPGDSIRTGQTGRVLLMRGEETILISPNSAIGIPAGNREAVDHHHSAGRLDPARGRKAQRQAFRGRDAVSRRRGEGHPVPRHGEQGETASTWSAARSR